ncbi:hypothetical protein, partial [Streptomyces palmae]|uniref:hypothetical protein n=1 Tax=Streptomyces palmae TaxID=1701085 RepID=UPI001AE0D5FB
SPTRPCRAGSGTYRPVLVRGRSGDAAVSGRGGDRRAGAVAVRGGGSAVVRGPGGGETWT